jgi:transcriptional regulator with XRE-family HTH domain
VAAQIGHGTTQARVHEWETGSKLIRISTLLRVCGQLRTGIGDVLTSAETYARDEAEGRPASIVRIPDVAGLMPQSDTGPMLDADAFRYALGLLLRARRTQLGFSQAVVASRVGRGTTQARIHEWESGERLIRLSTLLHLCFALHFSIGDVATSAETYARAAASTTTPLAWTSRQAGEEHS